MREINLEEILLKYRPTLLNYPQFRTDVLNAMKEACNQTISMINLRDLIEILIIIYITICSINLWYFTVAYSEEGKWKSLHWNNFDNILILFPVLNIGTLVSLIFNGSPYHHSLRQ